jgi:hypothetical protein
VAGSFGVLISTSSGKLTISLIAVDGKVAASAQADAPMSLFCSNGATAALAQPVSTSDTRAYFMDATGVVRFLSPDGQTGRVGSLPLLGAARRSFFAVSPDDKRIAVAVVDFASGASTKLYVEDLFTGAHHVDIFSESGASTLWPIGWHGTNELVLAKVLACPQGSIPFGCCAPQELHVVDPSTAVRRYTLGGSGCTIVGQATPAGAVCENSTFNSARVLGWNGVLMHAYAIQGPIGAYVSPSGANVAFVDNFGTTFTGGGSAMAGVFTCLWIDETHVLAGGNTQQQPRVGNLSTGVVKPVAAVGDCAGRIPGAL